MKLALRRFNHQQWGATAPQQNPFKAPHTAKATLPSWLERMAQSFMERLMADAEPKVWYTCDAEGNLWWHVHDLGKWAIALRCL